MGSLEHCDRLVLVVDDDSDIRTTVARLLTDEGYEVKTASDGGDALELLRASPNQLPCLILLDLTMPTMSGPDFCEVQDNDPELAGIPVLLISAHANLSQKAASLGHSYLRKPLRAQQLLDAVEQHCA